MSALTQFAYIVSAVLFIVGLKMLGRADSARRGNAVSAVGMLVAVVTILLQGGMNFSWIAGGIVVGTVIGVVVAQRVKMTGMPELVALLNGSGGLASLLVGWSEFHEDTTAPAFKFTAIFFAVVIGGIAFTGSLMAYGKLSERISGRPVMFPLQHIVNAGLLVGTLVVGAVLVGVTLDPQVHYGLFVAVVALSLVLGVLAVLPIGGADMPIVVSLLNSYSGIAASAAGFIIDNEVLIVSGALVGASGIILTQIMCKSMNRSLGNVLFSGFGAAVSSGKGSEVQGTVTPISAEDAYYILEGARNVVFVPGYGMAVAQAQHAVRELADLMTANGTEVRYAIHPVAGRMPGHMNVLLAEANVPYEQLVEPEDVNPTMEMVDVAIVIGANDVVNPAAREDESSPLYGMPIINADHARTVFVLKRSMKPGFAGVENPLFFKDNTRMLFGDAKAMVGQLVAEFKGA